MSATSTACGCGGACGGAPATGTGGFVRPRFFAGLLLTEDDLEALTGYVTGKDRFRNRMLVGAGVVSGLEVWCDPCGGGSVTVRPGYAVDGRGNDVVLGCPASVDVAALVRDLRIGAIGTDCGGCGEDGERGYGLYVSYAESPEQPVTPHGASGVASASRVRESYRFSVGHVGPDDPDDEPYHPWQRISGRLGDRRALDERRITAHRLQRYGTAATWAVRADGRPVAWTDAAAALYTEGATALETIPPSPGPEQIVELTDAVRRLAAGLARYDLAPEPPEVSPGVDEARTRLATARERLRPLATDEVFGDAAHTQVAQAVLATPADENGLAARLTAQGTPLTPELRSSLVTDVARLRGWLLSRLDTDATGTGCGARAEVSGVTLPRQVPADESGPITAADLSVLARAAIVVGDGVLGYATDTACASLQPPAPAARDSAVLLARLTLRDCDVVTVCTSGRRQWTPGGPGLGAWFGEVAAARALASRLCCTPISSTPAPESAENGAGSGTVPDLPFRSDLLGAWTDVLLDDLLNLLDPGSSGEQTPLIVEVTHTTSAEATELGELRKRLDELTRLVARLDTGTTGAEPAAPDAGGTAEDEAEDIPEEQPATPAPAKKAAPRTRRPRGGGR